MSFKLIARLAQLWCIALLLYGFLHIPDAPIKPCAQFDGTNFCGRWGQVHSAAEADHYLAWQRLLLLSCPFGLAASFLLWKRR